MPDFNSIPLHKPLPIRKLYFYGGEGDPYLVNNLMGESNLLFDAVIGKDGYGGERMLLLKPKLTLYFNRFDSSYNASILLMFGLNAGRNPIKILLGGSDLTRVQNPGEQWLSFAGVHSLTFQYNLATANKFFKSGLVFTGVIRPNANIYYEYTE